MKALYINSMRGGKESTKFVEERCGYKKTCSKQFGKDYYTKMRNRCAELTHLELNLFVKGEVSAAIHDSEKTHSHRQAHARVHPKSLDR